MAKLVRTRPAAGKFYESRAEQLTYEATRKPDAPTFEYRNRRGKAVALRTLSIYWQDPINDAHIPNLEVIAGQNRIVCPHGAGNPFKDIDLSLDFQNGVRLEPEESLSVYLWADNEGELPKKTATLLFDLGEA